MKLDSTVGTMVRDGDVNCVVKEVWYSGEFDHYTAWIARADSPSIGRHLRRNSENALIAEIRRQAANYDAHHTREVIQQLRDAGWTLYAIADELEVPRRTVENWAAGSRHPEQANLVLAALESLVGKKPPKQRRYGKREHIGPSV